MQLVGIQLIIYQYYLLWIQTEHLKRMPTTLIIFIILAHCSLCIGPKSLVC